MVCKMHRFMDGLGNNGFTNPIICSCSYHNPFSSRFPFPVTFHHCNVYMFNGLHNIPPLLSHGDHACVQNSWHLLEYKLFKAIPTL